MESDWHSRPEIIVSEEFTVEELDDGLSRITVKRSTDNASSWCCTQQFMFPGMTELDVVDEDDTVDDFDELDAGAAASITDCLRRSFEG